MGKEYFKLGTAFLILFVIFTFFVSLGIFKGIDNKLLFLSQNSIPRVVDTPFSAFSILGLAEVTGIFFLIILFLFSGIRKIYIFVFFVILILAELILKSIIPQLPPPHELVRTNIHLGVPSGEIAGERFAYPSGHAGRTAFIAIILLFVLFKSSIKKNYKQIFAFLILTFAFFMFVSRIYLAEHFATDVAGGALLGFSLAFLGIYFYKRPLKFKK